MSKKNKHEIPVTFSLSDDDMERVEKICEHYKDLGVGFKDANQFFKMTMSINGEEYVRYVLNTFEMLINQEKLKDTAAEIEQQTDDNELDEWESFMNSIRSAINDLNSNQVEKAKETLTDLLTSLCEFVPQDDEED